MNTPSPRRALRAALTLSAAGLLGLLPGRPAAAQGPGPLVWSSLPEDNPRAGHVALLTPDGQMLVVGGEAGPNVTARGPRTLDLSAMQEGWKDVTTSGAGPRSRLAGRGLVGAAAVVEPIGESLLLTCDCAEQRTSYRLDVITGAWTATAGPQPPALWYPILVHDAPRHRALLIGGDLSGTAILSGEVWAYDFAAPGAGWSKLGDAPWPEALLFSAYAVDPAGGQLQVFSGQDANGVLNDRLWQVDLARVTEPAAWRGSTEADGPVGRLGASLVFDPRSGNGYLVGGYRITDQGLPEDLTDLWLLRPGQADGERWTPLSFRADRQPLARSGHAAIWDPTGERLVVHGGAYSGTNEVRYLGDVWALAPEPDPAPRIYLPIAYRGEAPPRRAR